MLFHARELTSEKPSDLNFVLSPQAQELPPPQPGHAGVWH